MFGRAACLVAMVAMAAVVTAVSGQVSQATKDAIDQKLDNLETTMYTMNRQLMLQKLAFEESMRSDGDSGVKQIRVNRDGTSAYFSPSHVSSSSVAIHDHSELERTCGMGEFEGVLNGVHFRTRHNDYQLVKPSTTDGKYHALEAVEYPPVPPEILNQTDLTKAFRDMRAYFRAWQTGNDSVLDYKPYFRPVLCYLEGAWTNDVDLDEPFDSERHHLDALSWFDLQEKARFTAYAGDKDIAENYAYLPTAIVNITEGQPVLAQWNYRIACNPIDGDLLQLEHLKPVDDLHSRLSSGKTLDQWVTTRKARFQISESENDNVFPRGTSLLDRIMAQIPGKDNFAADIEDTNMGTTKYSMLDNEEKLNAGFYHRFVYVEENDAMGVKINKRGFADRQLFVAQSTQSRVVPMEINFCERGTNNCQLNQARVSYAIPLEIIWTTPLNSWNPYRLARYENGVSMANGRTGGFEPSTAFNGTDYRHHFLTPHQFFLGGEIEVDPADTVPGAVGVLDPWDNIRSVVASDIRIFLPGILDVGNVRTRYPIFPVYGEGNTDYKEIEALEKFIVDLNDNLRYLRTIPNFGFDNATTDDTPKPDLDVMFFKMQTAPSNMTNRGSHIHYVDLRSKHAMYAMDGCETYQVRTLLSKYHTHLMTILFNSTSEEWEYLDCDGKPTCRDNHGVTLTPIKV